MFRSLGSSAISPRGWTAVLALLALVLGAALGAAPPASAFPPDVPSKARVQYELDRLTVAREGSMTGYDREKFPHWNAVSGNCNTREWVLRRDGDDVTTGADCYPDSGSWYSYFDGVTRTAPSQISIDHIVALAEAWRSGARGWSTSRREAFANDVTGPQLIAVTTEVNSSKGDRDPSDWRPPRTSSWCGYAKFWIHTKYRWNLTIDSAEKSAVQSMLDRCYY
ncbi:HNH endonuclease family protein [Streptomyces sp. MAR4 CNX-425]|uniref:HNH endonuclease family protein n=1 Tax=Streptomyces sp. MAR4 CNX-425 TaxID=3406343 RepID=UPI003B50AE81